MPYEPKEIKPKPMRIARVSFKGNKEAMYDFFVLNDFIEVGDFAIVNTKLGPSLATVEKLLPWEQRTDIVKAFVIGRLPKFYCAEQLKLGEAEVERLLALEAEEDDLLA